MYTLKLKELLDSRGIKQKELADASGVRPSTISAICRNYTDRISLPALEKICLALGCTPNDIIEILPDAEE